MAVEVFDVLADGAARATGNGEIQPCRIGLGVFGSDDFNGVAGFEFGTQGHHGVVDAGGDGFVSDVGVDGVGEVYGCRTLRQRENFAFRRQDIDFVGEQIDFDVLKELDSVRAAGLQIKDVFQPLVSMEDSLIDGIFAGFVYPVSGDASFGYSVHFARADLDFNGQSVRTDQSCVQALVAVAFGDGDIVFEAAGLGLVEIVQRAEGGITGGDAVDDDAEAVNVHDFGKAQFFRQHFLMDTVQVFFPPFDFGFDVHADQTLAEGTQNFADDIAAVFAAVIHRFFKGFIAAWVEILKR